MLNFIHFLTESTEDDGQLKHITHAEDHPLIDGHAGFEHAYGALMKAHHHMVAKKHNSNLTMKYDGCISGDSVILTSNGNKEIQQIVKEWHLNKDEYVLSFDFEQNSLVFNKVLDVLNTQTTKNWLQIEFENDSTIKMTEDHELYTINRGWIQAKDLTIGDDIFQVDRNSEEISEN